ncbi:valyl-tRNA synthetase [Parabacteroides sp. CAG:409]|nr:valyl-tRNA synthetase [Parabacteroides sp. CAG:409]
MENELNYKLGFVESIKKKLNNEKFINKAPAQVVEVERKKLSDAEKTIQSLRESIEQLKQML